MKISSFSSLAAGVLASTACVGAEDTAGAATAERNGVLLALRLERKHIAGNAILATATLTNESQRTVTYGHTNYYRDFSITLKSQRGALVPLTRFGRQRIGGEPEERFKYVRRELPPGASFSVVLNLSRLFDLTESGSYVFGVSKSVNENTRREFVVRIAGYIFAVSDPPPDSLRYAEKVEAYLLQQPAERLEDMKKCLEKIARMKADLQSKTGGNNAESLDKALAALRYFEGMRACSYVCVGLDHPLGSVKIEALQALRRLGDASVVPLIVKAMKRVIAEEETAIVGGEGSAARHTILGEGVKALERLTGKKLLVGSGPHYSLQSIRAALEKATSATASDDRK